MSEDFALILYEPTKPRLKEQLQKLNGGKSFLWDNPENERQAEEYYEAAILAADISERDQMLHQLREVFKLTLQDLLQRHGATATFGSATALFGTHPLNTTRIILTPRVFEILRVLGNYPYHGAFGCKGLELGTIKIYEGRGRQLMLFNFIGEICSVTC